MRLDYFFANETGEEGEPGAKRHTTRFEAEYAFTPLLSLELDVPYTFLNPDGNYSPVGGADISCRGTPQVRPCRLDRGHPWPLTPPAGATRTTVDSAAQGVSSYLPDKPGLPQI